MTNPIIEMRGVSKRYKARFKSPLLAVDNVSFSVAQGESFGFIGKNGAGKSTTIKILTGALRMDAGQARLNGYELDNPLARKGVGYVPESPSLFDYLTPMEVLEMSARFHGLKGNIKQECRHWLERFDLAHVAKKTIRGFSKGMAQRTALAQALVIKPSLLILDEPLSGLDPIGRKDVVDILLEYRKSGGTIFFSSHVLHDVERLADRFGLIHNGQLRLVSEPGDLASEQDRFVIRSLGEAPVLGMTSDVGGRWYIEVPSSEVWQTLKRIEGAGHRLIEAKPALSLETAFLNFVSKTDQ